MCPLFLITLFDGQLVKLTLSFYSIRHLSNGNGWQKKACYLVMVHWVTSRVLYIRLTHIPQNTAD